MGCAKCASLRRPEKDASACRVAGKRDLEVPEGESLVLSPHVKKYAPYFIQIVPKTLSEMKEIIGVPDGLHATCGHRKLSLPSAPLRFVGTGGPEADIANAFVRKATEEFIYRDSVSVAAFVPILEGLLPAVVLHVGLFQDLIVRKNSTLTIAREIDRLTVRNVIIEPGGRLVLRGSNLLIKARSFRGGIPKRPAVSVTTQEIAI